MCGACGSGRVRAPWEDRIIPDPRGPARRAAALTRWLAPWRWRVTAWPGGYTITTPHGALAPATGVDEVVARAGAARPDLLGHRLRRVRARAGEGLEPWAGSAVGRGTVGPDGVGVAGLAGLSLAEAVVHTSAVAMTGGSARPITLTGPAPGAHRLLAHHGVVVLVVPAPTTTWGVHTTAEAGSEVPG